MCPNQKIHTTFHEQIFHSKPVSIRNPYPGQCFQLGTIIQILIWAIHWSMTVNYYPWVFSSVLRLRCFLKIIFMNYKLAIAEDGVRKRMNNYLEILYKPFELINQRFDSILKIIVEFGRNTNEMNWSNIPTIKHGFGVTRHSESFLVMQEVAVKYKLNFQLRFRSKFYLNSNNFTYSRSSWFPGHVM